MALSMLAQLLSLLFVVTSLICLILPMDWRSRFITYWMTKWTISAEPIRFETTRTRGTASSLSSLFFRRLCRSGRLLCNAPENRARSWRTLFTYLPPPKDLFEQALKLDALKTAVGYLLVPAAFEDDEEQGMTAAFEEYVVRLIALASKKGDWELCAELARFLIALDASGDMLQARDCPSWSTIRLTACHQGRTLWRGHSVWICGIHGLGLNSSSQVAIVVISFRSSSLSPLPSGRDGDLSDENPIFCRDPS
ncbi:Ribosome control protein 1 [Penicillium bovifimosum]|uniref:Ribosome control protein 1 n=1 Tax=Penicillium bovifimosum TaxID=126998 RepID=A0A9W9LAQ4_9EURO|nr:Ribosome control protein 1 [Penicillium bovifimosum]KAJ5145437.1 Ribosome control protein 1 [Penicillium bovifimosum]